MPSPNRNNIYKYFFFASACLIILAVVLGLGFNWDIKSLMNNGIVPAAMLTFILGLLTMVTRPRRLEDGRNEAEAMANHLLNQIAQSEIGHLLTASSADTLQIARIIESSPVGRELYKPLLDKIYQRVPACLLPRHYGTAKHPVLDWHLYDLCIIVAKEDVFLAKKIKDKLLAQDDGLRIYIDVADAESMGEPSQPFIRRVFYASSRRCLALLSIYAVNDARRKAELNEAMRRAQLKNVPCQNYLFAVPIDDPGLKAMGQDTFLEKYAKYVEVIPDPKKLSEALAQKVIRLMFPQPLPPPSGDDEGQSGKKRFAIALSFTSEYREHVERITQELKKRLSDKDLVFLYTEKKYEHEVGTDLNEWLKNLYRYNSELIVVFLCREYEKKKWCQVEWDVVRELLDTRDSHSIMLATLDNARIRDLNEDIHRSDCEDRRPAEIAELIFNRLSFLRQPDDPRRTTSK
ncbi:MAG: TIR domain-containing protein [Blastocatellia bacterium]